MSVGFNDDFVSALEELAKRLQLVDETTFKAIHVARAQWTALAAINAIQRLGRPHWLLAQSITIKVCDYYDDRKVHAMYGFRFRAGRRLNVKTRARRLFAGSWATTVSTSTGARGGAAFHIARRITSCATRKSKPSPILDALLNKHFNAVMKEELQKELARIKSARKNERRQGRRYDPEGGYSRH